MPHNLYLHSALVQTRQYEQSFEGKREACKFNFLDSFVALNGAFFINAAILILASAVFFTRGQVVTEIQQAHTLLSPLLGTTAAGLLFAVALLASGQSSTVTGTLAGQIVMEGFLHLRIRPVVRRILTRLIAIIPAIIVIGMFGESSTLGLLIASQVILSLQLSFALIPLIQFTGNRKLMGQFTNSWWVKVLSWVTAGVVLGLNAKYVIEFESALLDPVSNHHLLGIILLLLTIIIGGFLIYIIIHPIKGKYIGRQILSRFPSTFQASTITQKMYNVVGAAVEGNQDDIQVIEQARLMACEGGTVVLIHIVNSPITIFHGAETRDSAATAGESYLGGLKDSLSADHAHSYRRALGFGLPPDELVRIANEEKLDLLVMRSHGHRGLKDLIFGATISPVRHKLSIPIFIVK
jgi:manganese transport protein